MIFSSLSGYDIRETVKIWERMKELNKGKEPPEFMSTHPSSDTRIKQLNEWMNEVILDYPPIEIKLIQLMVSRDGLEPSTHSLKGNCSTN